MNTWSSPAELETMMGDGATGFLGDLNADIGLCGVESTGVDARGIFDDVSVRFAPANSTVPLVSEWSELFALPRLLSGGNWL
jgi:hypothetical protein